MDPFTLMLIGTGVNMFGQYMANMDQAAAERESAAFLREQERVARLQQFRSMNEVRKKYASAYGNQLSGYAAGGVDVGSGAAADVVGATLADAIMELEAVRQDTELNIKLTRARAGRAQKAADTLSSTNFNLMQAGGTLLSAYGKSEGFGTWERNDGPLTPKYNNG